MWRRVDFLKAISFSGGEVTVNPFTVFTTVNLIATLFTTEQNTPKRINIRFWETVHLPLP